MRKRITLAAPRRIQRKAALRRLVKSVLDAEGCSRRVNIVLTDDETLRDLNKRFKKRKGPTDVLAFDFEEPDFLGEVYVSLDRAREQARHYGVSEEEEIERLVLHGLLTAILILLGASAFFSSAETAYFSISPLRSIKALGVE
jgi:rRNA maturation RNase YbeY